MKKIKVLSLLSLFAFGQISSLHAQQIVRPGSELSFVFAYQAIDELNRNIISDNDDVAALSLIKTMNDCINFDIAQKKALDGAKNTFLYNGAPLDPAKIAADDKELQDRINTLDGNIKSFEKGGILPTERKKINNRREERREKQAALAANLAALQANTAAENAAKNAQAQIGALRSKNALVIEQAIESYIATFAQCYIPSGSSSIVISSKYNPNLPVTPKEFKQLVATLTSAASQFGTSMLIDINLANAAPLTISNTVAALNRMPLSSSSTQSWAAFGAKAAVGTAAAIAGTAIAYNLYQNKSWNDTSDAQSLFDAAYNAYQDNLLPGAQALSEQAWAQANGYYQSANDAASQASQSANDWYTANFGA